MNEFNKIFHKYITKYELVSIYFDLFCIQKEVKEQMLFDKYVTLCLSYGITIDFAINNKSIIVCHSGRYWVFNYIEIISKESFEFILEKTLPILKHEITEIHSNLATIGKPKRNKKQTKPAETNLFFNFKLIK